MVFNGTSGMTRIGKKNWNGPQQTRNTPEWIEWTGMVQNWNGIRLQ